MSQPPLAYTRFLNMLRALGEPMSTTGLSDILAIDELLTFIYDGTVVADRVVRVVDVARTNRFGTPPTVIKRLQDMEAAGWIETEVATDRRAKSLRVSKTGLQRLNDRADMMRKLVMQGG